MATLTPRRNSDRSATRIWLDMLGCTSLIEARVRSELRRRFRTTLPRYELLDQLSAARADKPQGLTMTEISRRLLVSNGNVTLLTDRLVEEKLVRRSQSPTDRRTQLISLTSAGARSLRAMKSNHSEWIQRLVGSLSREEQRRLCGLLGKLRSAIEVMPERRNHR